VSRQLTAASAITSASLMHCESGEAATEQWVQPRQARRDWSAMAAWWVGSQLKVPRPRPILGPAVDESEMQGFLVALARIKRRTAEDVRMARDSLMQIVLRRPDFAMAQARLATAHLLSFEYGVLTLPQALEQADAAIGAALAIAPDLGMAHAARGLYWMNQERYDLAVPQLARAAALDPGEGVILLWLGNALLYNGNPLAARPWLERAFNLDPDLVSARISLGEAACFSAMTVECERFLDSPGAGPMAGFMAALIRAQLGDIEQAQRSLDRVPQDVNHQWVMDLRGDLCGMSRTGSDRCQPYATAMPRWAASPDPGQPVPPAPMLDLWRIDLGLASWVRWARQSEESRQRLDQELLRLRDAGLKLPLLDDIDYCLRQWQRPELGTRRTAMAPMLQAWGCAVEPADS
jgi:tetratricopeptide (TPR) repeat protein